VRVKFSQQKIFTVLPGWLMTEYVRHNFMIYTDEQQHATMCDRTWILLKLFKLQL